MIPDGVRAGRGRLQPILAAAGLGVGMGLLAFAAGLGAVLLYSHQRLGGSRWADVVILEVPRLTLPMLLGYAVLGALTGIAALACMAGQRRPYALLRVIAGFWAALSVIAIFYAPASLSRTPGINRLPYVVPVGIFVTLWALLGLATSARRTRYILATGVLAALAFIPAPAPSTPDGSFADRSVLLLGVDNLTRGSMWDLAKRIALRAPSRSGQLRFLDGVVSAVPLTRFAWAGIVTGTNPVELFELDTLPPADRARALARMDHAFPKLAARYGYTTTFLTDDAATNAFAAGELFDSVVQDNVGWQAELRVVVGHALPLYDAFWGRWVGVGSATLPGAWRPLRLLGATATALQSTDGRPQLVGVHAVGLHGPFRPLFAEIGGLNRFLRTEPRDLSTPGLDELSAEAITRQSPAPQPELYASRSATMINDVAGFIARLMAAKFTQRSLIVVFSDHGEFFRGRPERNLTGLHGTLLEPSSVQVGAIVILPESWGSDRPQIVRGTFPLNDINALVREFISSDGTPTTQGQPLLATIAEAGSLPRRQVPVHSFGRLAAGADVYGDRRVVEAPLMRDGLWLWPDGRMSMSAHLAVLMRAASDSGWSDGYSLVAYSPLKSGDLLRTTFDSIATGSWEPLRVTESLIRAHRPLPPANGDAIGGVPVSAPVIPATLHPVESSNIPAAVINR